MKYQWFHECETPEIPTKKVKFKVTRRTFWGKEKTEIIEEEQYIHKHLQWKCHACGTEWEFWALGEKVRSWDYWQVKHRPVVWKEFYEGF